MLKVLGVSVKKGDTLDMIVSSRVLPSRCCGAKVVKVLSDSSKLIIKYNNKESILPVNCIFYVDVTARVISGGRRKML